ncbi:MAG: YicC/YloC family endoribonuclease [Kiloniellales bacterium]
MSVTSMTGFARADGRHGDTRWTWEVKSINGRGLDIRCRLPAGFERLEAVTRDAVPRRVARGSVTVALQLTRPEGGTEYRINRALLARLIDLHGELDGQVDPVPPRLETLLGVRGVVEASDAVESEDERAAQDAALSDSLMRALDSLASTRRQEGEQLRQVLGRHLDDIDRLCREADGLAALRPEAMKARLRTQVEALIEASPALPEERLAQEAALLAAKADVREELDRLKGHVAAARDLLDGDGPIGRRLDFLCQEFNREANTLCSKSSDPALGRVGLALKAAIDQLREQTQNVE